MQRRKHNVLEVNGRTVEEAIADGLSHLGIDRDEVLIEILNRGRRRLFGLGAEAAQVRILYPAEMDGGDDGESPRDSEEEAAASSVQRAPQVTEDAGEASTEGPPAGESDAALTFAPSEELPQIAQATVSELLERMGIQAQVVVHEPHPDQPLTLDIIGEGVSDLIGPRGETLNALQYIARLIASRELQHWVTFFLDVEGYRERRAKELQDLAHRMAERVAMSKQPLALEPMPAHERRILHIALRDHPLAATESVGQGEHRRVTISLRE